MGNNPFQDQLLKAGLTTEKKIRKQSQAKSQENKNKAGKKKKKGPKELSESQRLAQKAEAEKREKDRLLNLQKEDVAKQKAIIAQIKQLIEMNEIETPDGEVVYNFEDNKAVKRVYVTDRLHTQISQGSCAIVKFDDKYSVVPAIVATKIKQRDDVYIIVLNDASSEEVIDDEYADYAIPDDLMW